MGDAAAPDREPEAKTVLTCDLLRRAREGDEEAERELFELHRAWLLGQARDHPRFAYVRRTTSAEDLVQEVLTRFLRHGYLAGFEDKGRGSLRRFLRTILDRVITDHIRRVGAQKRGGNTRIGSLDEWSGDGGGVADPGKRIPAGDPTPTSRSRDQELRGICRETLSEEEWEVFRMIKLEDRTSREAGEILGRDPATVRGILARARRRLIIKLRSSWDGPSGG